MDQQDDAQDIPMMDAPDPIPNPSPAQRFSIVDVLRNEATEASSMDAKDMTTKGSNSAPDPMHSNLYECDEAIVLKRLQRLYPHTDIQKLPRHWNKNDRWMPGAVAAAHNQQGGTVSNPANQAQVLELSSDFLRVTKRKGDTKNSKDAASVRANRPIPRSCIVFYFEITVVNKGTGGYMGIGLSEKSVSLNRLPGWDQTSYGYHGDDGNFFASSGKGVEYGPTFTTGDVVGCGLNFVTREVFFTKNGTHLGVATTRPIPLTNDLYPIVGMQTADEMIDVNFGQRPFVFNIFAEMEGAALATRNAIASIELPPEKVLWMNSLIAKWMTHEGYSKALEALNRATVDTKSIDLAVAGQAKEDRQDSQSPTMAAETVANSVMQSIIVFGGGGGDNSCDSNNNDAPVGSGAGVVKRRTVVRSVQEALHEEMEREQLEHEKMEQRRIVLRMVKQGQLTDAVRHIEQNYPTLMESNRQLALLLKIQQFIEMLSAIPRKRSSSPVNKQHQLQQCLQQHSSPISTQLQYHHHQSRVSHSSSSSPRPTSSRGGKRAAASDVDHNCCGGAGDLSLIAGTSSSGSGGDAGGGTAADGVGNLCHNPVKRRSSDEECASTDEQRTMTTTTTVQVSQSINRQHHQNGNSLLAPSALAQMVATTDDGNSFMDIGEDSRDGLMLMDTTSVSDMLMMANGACHANGDILIGTPPTSTTIIDEPAGEIDLINADGVTIELTDEQQQLDEAAQHGGFTSADELKQFEPYKNLLEFGFNISQFALKMDAIDGPGQGSMALRQRMHDAFSLICYPDPTHSDHAYLFDQSQRDLVAKALNAAILEMEGYESVSPLDKCFRRARYIRDQALVFSASSVFADPNRLIDADASTLDFPMDDIASSSFADGQKKTAYEEGSARTTTTGVHFPTSSDADEQKADEEQE